MSHEPAFAVTSKQPATSVASAIGFSPMVMLLVPGVSGSLSMTVTSAPVNAVLGFGVQVATATVPTVGCRMNAK